ncbi:rod shape-determining protein MreD [Marinomonas piezotolerans]|uniref:Rod shape-determining protein MreD n=1 Tax=Marinomonas piezotolerans TaxID=2213058 RepID=A0A370UDA4_9GAMM|nr:rod shape-determining protein MreD [Marinomonas piezotolerans]RDL45764.1 rod shape-determining protein MreD [Marinomonas piezotolerans]
MKSSFVFCLTFIVALMLEGLTFPSHLVWFRPEWALLVVLYWVIALPLRVGVGVAWFLGLLVDLLQGGVIGYHSLTYVLITFMCAVLYKRLRMYRRWQQAMFIFLLVSINQLIGFWLDHYSGDAEPTLMIFMPAIITALLWPWCFIILRSIRRLYSIQ